MYTPRSSNTNFSGEWFATQIEKTGSGTFAAVLLGEYFLVTTDPGNIKVVLATEFNNFEKGKSTACNRVFIDSSLSFRFFLSRIPGISVWRRRFQCRWYVQLACSCHCVGLSFNRGPLEVRRS